MMGPFSRVEELLHNKGLRPRAQWLESCLNGLAASQPGFAGLSADKQAELCFGQFLMADFNVAGAAVLPPSIHTLHATELAGPFVLQVDEIIDISHSLRDRYNEKPAGPGRTLKLSITDGVQRVWGLEYRPIHALQVFSPAGVKISLRDVCVRRGLFMLVPEVLEILGGHVESLESARLRAVQIVNKPPRGKRSRQGVEEPPLAERATLAAWPPVAPEDAGVARENNEQTEQHSHMVPSHAPGLHTSNSANIPSVLSTRAPVVQQEDLQPRQQGENRWPLHQDQPPGSSVQSAQVSHVQYFVSMPSAHQQEDYQPMAPGQPVESRHQPQVSHIEHPVRGISEQQGKHEPRQTNCTTERVRGSGEHSVGMETLQEAKSPRPMERDGPAESSREVTGVSGNCPVILEDADEENQVKTPPQVQSAVLIRQFGTHESISTDENNGQYSSSSKNLHRLTQSRSSFVRKTQEPEPPEQPLARTTLQQPPQQCLQQPLQSSGADPETPMELDDSQDSEQDPAPIIRTPPSKIEAFRDKVPFTYLAVLKDRTNSQMDQNAVVRGKVKCVITGVVSFQYKDSDVFKLRVHIEDGSCITSAFVQHQVVQRLVGYSPSEVITGLKSPDTHKEMLDNMIRFQKFLERYEGFMHVEFADSSSVPMILQMTEGVQGADVKLLLDRVQYLMNKQTANNDLIDLSTP